MSENEVSLFYIRLKRTNIPSLHPEYMMKVTWDVSLVSNVANIRNLYLRKSYCVSSCVPKAISNRIPRMWVLLSLLILSYHFRICPNFFFQNYEESYDSKCYPCIGACPKVCLAADINYVEDAYKLHGCQIISGSIHININIAADRPELMDELAKYLGSIEEIYGFLKIYRWLAIILF